MDPKILSLCHRRVQRMDVRMRHRGCGLATGEGAEGVPAALVRGLSWTVADTPAAAIVRPIEEDLFR